ncbi:MAG: A24 family peptidase [Geminicoccaceae bacterium]|nr:A24 family peptidase [Geminicoccaceae bacterium]
MSHELVSILVLVPLFLVLAWVVREDLRARRIPNPAVLAILALWPAHLLLLGRPSPWWSGPSAALLVLGGGFVAWRLGLLGAGDVKLASALSASVGLEGLVGFLLATGLLGGLLALVVLFVERAFPMLAFSLSRFGGGALFERLCRGFGSAAVGRRASVPYGVAIAIAGLLAIGGPLWMP